MKKLMILFKMIFLFNIVFSQKLSVYVKEIKKEFENINKIYYDTIIKMDDFGNSAEGGEIKYYLKNKKIKKILTKYYGETGYVIEEYYIKNDSLFFLYKINAIYKHSITYNHNIEIVKKEEYRYYFKNNKIIKYYIPKTDLGFINIKEENILYIDEFNRFKLMLEKKN